MKKILFLLVFLLTFIVNAQTITGIYINQNIGAMGADAVGEDNKLTGKAKIPKIYEYRYSNNKSSLILLSEGGKIIDTLKRKLDDYNYDYETVETTITPSKVQYYKDLKKKSFEKLSVMENVETFIQDSLPQIDWKLTNDKKTIYGYTCSKATAARTVMGYPLNITAWFCDKIPINDGPFDFQGLPGFIMELEVNGLSVTKFVNLKFSEKNSVEIVPLKSNVKPITIAEFEKRVMR